MKSFEVLLMSKNSSKEKFRSTFNLYLNYFLKKL